MKKIPLMVLLFVCPLMPELSMATGYSPAGRVSFASGDVSVVHGNEEIPLGMDQVVFASDIVITGASGRARLDMKDGTTLYVGRMSRISIDDYRMRNDSLVSGLFNMLWGKVRFVVAKLRQRESSFTVKTTTTTIGVRGTVFTVVVPKPAELPEAMPGRMPESMRLPKVPAKVLLQKGKIVARSFLGEQRVIQPGYMAEVSTDGAMQVRRYSATDLDAAHIGIPGATESSPAQPGAGSDAARHQHAIQPHAGSQADLLPGGPRLGPQVESQAEPPVGPHPGLQTTPPVTPQVAMRVMPPMTPHVPMHIAPPVTPHVTLPTPVTPHVTLPAQAVPHVMPPVLPPVARGVRPVPVP